MPAPVPLKGVDRDVGVSSPEEAQWMQVQLRWSRGWRRLFLPTVFLVYLVFVGQAISRHPQDRIVGWVALGVFVVAYEALTIQAWRPVSSRFWRSWRFWTPYLLLYVGLVAVLPSAHATGFVLCLYIAAISVVRFGVRAAAPIVAVLALAALFVPVTIRSWHTDLSTSFSDVTPLGILVVGIVTFGVMQLQRANRGLTEARAQIARLSAENERSRIARDLHDLLGHSLTTITVKAGLARRLGETDPERAIEEIAEVEKLSRRALGEVRGVVSSYREVTLAGELARARELLRASGVDADLPTAVDVVDGDRHELFGWVLREGITNVVRHSRATACTVTLSHTAVEISDNGIGGPMGSGNGLAGLKERVAAVGAMLDAGPTVPRGWRLRVAVDPAVVTTTP
jgi:two-component system, NarL family, sensor histidine kinase DesK